MSEDKLFLRYEKCTDGAIRLFLTRRVNQNTIVLKSIYMAPGDGLTVNLALKRRYTRKTKG